VHSGVTERGTIYNPVLLGVDWVHASEIANKPRQDRPPLNDRHPPLKTTATQRKRNGRASQRSDPKGGAGNFPALFLRKYG
jgi:hypothetical protein